MADLNGFNAENVEPGGNFEPVPAGTYLAMIMASEKKETKAGNGHYLEFVLTITDGDYKGRQLWDRLNLWNPNTQAVEIAQKTLSAICRAVGVMQPRDSVELHNVPMQVTVKLTIRKDTGEPSNEIKGYAARATSPTQPQQSQPAIGGAPPWKR